MITSSTITIPKNHPRRPQLERKLEEYRRRLESPEYSGRQMMTICQIAVLEKLLNDSIVATHALSQELAQKYGESFDPMLFDKACNVIIDYGNTGGQNVQGGTGLS